jgi:hypothetical protein
MLDCYVYDAFSIVMYVMHFLYAGFWRLLREADKISKKIIFLYSSVMFISSPIHIIYVPQLAEEHKFRYVPQLTKERKVGYVPRF